MISSILNSALIVVYIVHVVSNRPSNRYPSWYRLYSGLPNPTPSLGVSMMEYNTFLTNGDEDLSLNRGSISGYDERFLPRNMSRFILPKQEKTDEILCEPTQEEIRQLYHIKKYNEIVHILKLLTSTTVSEKEKMDLIRMSEFLTNISGESMASNINPGDLLDDWEWNIDDSID
jgi:hypothetical protein